MKSSKSLMLWTALAIGSALVLGGCPKKTELASTPEAQVATTATGDAQAQSGTAATQEGNARNGQGPEGGETAAAGGGGLQPIHFDFDRAVIRGDAHRVLQANADWLKAHPDTKVRIEGNCDERGTIEYNQALAQRRAAAARRYLTDLGVSQNRISLVSYGKEKPSCSENTETCWQENRRDDFVALND